MDRCDDTPKIVCAKNIQKNETRIDGIENSIESLKKVISTVDAGLNSEMKILSKSISEVALSLNTILTKLEERNAKATEVALQNQAQFEKLNKRIDEIETIVTDTKVIESKLANLEKVMYGFIALCATTATAILFKNYL